MTRHRILLALLFAMAVLVSFGNSIKAQGPIVTEDESKVNIYKRFTDNRVPNPPTAYAAAKEYLQRYPKDSDQYTNYFKQWIEEYEFEERECKLLQDIYRDKAFAPAYELGKTVLAEDPENLKVLLALGYGGYLATSGSKNASLNAEAIRYANKAIQLIEAGFSEGTIVKRIEGSPVDFDLSPKSLATLRQNRVSERIIKAMTDAMDDGKK